MATLWLIRHGEILFWALAVVSLAAGALGPSTLRWLRVGSVLRASGRLQEGPTGTDRFDEGACVTIAGRLETEGTSCQSFDGGLQAAAASIEVPRLPRRSVRAPRLFVQVAGLRVELAVAVDVTRGSTERWDRWASGKLPRPLAEQAAMLGLEVGAVPHRRSVRRALAAGDVVRAAGRLEAGSATRETGDYRQPARRWRLVGDLPDGAIALAFAGRPRLRFSRTSRVRGALLALIGFGGLAGLGGELMVQSDERTLLGLAAATHFHREAALTALAERVRSASAPTRSAIDAALALGRVPRFCGTAAVALLRAQEPAHAAQLGERCRTDLGWGTAARAWTLLGDLGRASRAAAHVQWTVDPRADVRMHLLAGELRRAAASARRSEGALPPCLADALEAHAGDADALARLGSAARAATSARRSCALLFADLLEGQDRVELLARWAATAPAGGWRHPSSWERLSTLLILEADPTRLALADLEFAPASDVSNDCCGGPVSGERVLPEVNPERLVLENETELHGVPALERSVLARLGSFPGAETLSRSSWTWRVERMALRARIAASSAALESVAGRNDEARAWADTALEQLGALASALPRPRADVAAALDEVRGLRAAIELRAGAFDAGRQALEDVFARAWFGPALRAVAQNRGTSLPRVDCTGREPPAAHCAVARWTGASFGWSVLDSATATTMRQLTATADLARIAHHELPRGATRQARALRRRTALLRQALLDRKRAVLLAVLDGDPDLGPLASEPWNLGDGTAPAGQSRDSLTGWLAHHDTVSFQVHLATARCSTFVVEGEHSWMDLEMVVQQPAGAGEPTGRAVPGRSPPRVWRSQAWRGSLDVRGVRVCPGAPGNVRLDVRAGQVSGRFVVGWIDGGAP